MLHFSTIRWKNFLSTGNVFTEIQFDRSPSTVIVGENGAGKSTVLDALCFALFNKPFRSIKKPQLMNTINQKDLVVEVEFRSGGKEYKVVRGIKPAVFEIYKEGKLLDQTGAAKDYQIILEETILKLNYKSFTQIVVLGSASFTPFMQLSARDRREVIEDLLDIQIFSNMNLLLKDRIAENKNEMTEISYQIELVENKIDVQKEYLQQIQEDLQHQIEEYTWMIDQEMESIKTKQESVDKLNSEIQTLLDDIADKTSVENKSTKVDELLKKLKEKIKKGNKRVAFFHENCNCPTCDQEIDDDVKEKKIQDTNAILAKTEKAIQDLEKEEETLLARRNAIFEINSAISYKQTSVTEIQNEIQQCNKGIELYQNKIDSLRTKSVDNSSNNGTDTIDDLTNELTTINNRKEQLSYDKELYTVASSILKDGGIKTKIIRQYVPIINKLVNKYLAAMDFFVNFELDEEFNEVIKSRGRDDFSYASFSEGEKARIDISLMLTWRAVAKLKNSVNTNLLILDEVFDSSMDANGVEILMGLFNELSDTNIFVISHKGDVLVDKFRSQIKFEKVKSFSRIAA
jgi:DNA repair exonuclease SbcCD ATPase subunit